MYVFCSFSVALRNISVHTGVKKYLKESWYFGVQIDFISVSLIYGDFAKSLAHLEIAWKSPEILL